VGAHGLWGICAKVRYLVLMGAYGDESAAEQLGIWVPGPTRPRRTGSRRSLPLATRPAASAARSGEAQWPPLGAP